MATIKLSHEWSEDNTFDIVVEIILFVDPGPIVMTATYEIERYRYFLPSTEEELTEIIDSVHESIAEFTKLCKINNLIYQQDLSVADMTKDLKIIP